MEAAILGKLIDAQQPFDLIHVIDTPPVAFIGPVHAETQNYAEAKQAERHQPRRYRTVW